MRRLVLIFVCAAFPAMADTPTKPGRIFPGQPSGSRTLTLGGTAQNFMNAEPASSPLSCLIVNPLTATEQGIAGAESIYVNVIGSASATGGGASYVVAPGGSTITGPQTGAVSWVAATTGHLITGYCWQ